MENIHRSKKRYIYDKTDIENVPFSITLLCCPNPLMTPFPPALLLLYYVLLLRPPSQWKQYAEAHSSSTELVSAVGNAAYLMHITTYNAPTCP